MTTLTLYNSLSRRKEPFEPLDAKNVRMYVCGPTVYDAPHIGNARAVVVYDVLFRLLRQLYGENNVTYVRNITDVDDKIITAAKERGVTIDALTAQVTAGFHADMQALHNLAPTHEPKATGHISDMVAMIEALIANGGAYVGSDGKHVLFDVTSGKDYGKLSGKKLDDLIAGARVGVESYKKNPGDFVLWKPAAAGDDPSAVFDSPWGKGRPGWHIECSAMSTKYLGTDFDIHGGGADLKFPHHENEIAQSCGAHPGSHYAKIWVHNGFVTVNGEKMAKSAGNFVTVRELLDRGVKGEVIRYALLSAKYNEPLDWTEKRLEEAKKALDGFYRIVTPASAGVRPDQTPQQLRGDMHGLFAPLFDDLNTAEFFTNLHKHKNHAEIVAALQQLGFLQETPEAWFKGGAGIDEAAIESQIAARKAAKAAKNYAEADSIRDELLAQGIILEDFPTGTTWRKA